MKLATPFPGVGRGAALAGSPWPAVCTLAGIFTPWSIRLYHAICFPMIEFATFTTTSAGRGAAGPAILLLLHERKGAG